MSRWIELSNKIKAKTEAPLDLNTVTPAEEDGDYTFPEAITGTESAELVCIFRNLKPALIGQIKRYPAVVGCVAWMTDLDICDALAEREAAQIILNKEDFLRPDVGGADKGQLRKRYAKLKFPLERGYDYVGNAGGLSYCCDPSIDAVRCCGSIEGSRVARPRQHNKFCVFCDIEKVSHPDSAPRSDLIADPIPGQDPYDLLESCPGPRLSLPDQTRLIPKAVWTGSFNWSYSAGRSLENAVIIKDAKIAAAYFDQWSHVLAISEPLNWEHEYCAPEWRIGS